MHDIVPGTSTDYVISFINNQPTELNVTLSLTDAGHLAGNGGGGGWSAQLDTVNITLPAQDSVYFQPVEVKLTITAPSQEYLDDLLERTDDEQTYEILHELELGIRAETSGMAADVAFTTTHLVNDSDKAGDDRSETKPTDRSMLNPWLVVVLLAVMLIVGAVVRDVIQDKFKRRKEKRGKGKDQDNTDDEETLADEE